VIELVNDELVLSTNIVQVASYLIQLNYYF